MTPSAGPAILHVVAGGAFGGGSGVVADIAAGASRDGFRVRVATTEPRLCDRLRGDGIDVIDSVAIARRLSPLRDASAVVALARHIRSERYDIVHTHTTKGGLVGRPAALLGAAPAVVHTVHGYGFHERSGAGGTRLGIGVERLLGALTTVVVTVSEHHRNVTVRSGIAKPAKVIAIPNGIDAPRVSMRVGAPSGGRRGLAVAVSSGHGDQTGVRAPVRILTHGRLARQKGIEYLLTAVAELHHDVRARVRVRIAGEGELEGWLRRRIDQLAIGDVVELCGFRADIGDLLTDTDIVVLPSLWEGLSISLLEAFAMGRAVITTDIASNREVCGPGAAAVLVPPGESGPLVGAITALVGSPARRDELGAAARQRYLDAYTKQRMVDDYLRLYRELVSA